MKKYVSGPSEFRAAFSGRDMDSKELAAQRQFIEKLELAVVAANREVIHKTIPNLSQATFQSLAVMVARHRAHYLEAAVKLASAPGQHDPAAFADLKQKREFFEESRAAFDALERAIERGYVEIGK